MKCCHFDLKLKLSLVDLGSAPPSNAYLTKQILQDLEKWFSLRVLVCDSCGLVRTEDFVDEHELFDAEYAYFSVFFSSWLAYYDRYVAAMVERFGINTQSLAIDVAANDGYLLKYLQTRGIPCLGIKALVPVLQIE
jgi:Putative zinc binding domain